MQQTRPLFLIRKYRSILTAAVIVESVNYIVSLTDSIVAGSILGSDALVGIGLITPFLTFTYFVASIIISGTVKNYSYEIGRFDRKRASEFFSEGLCLSLLVGAVYVCLLLVLRRPILSWITPSGAIRAYAGKYFNIILVFFFLTPVANLLDNLVIADGNEKLSAAANVIMIVSNVAFSFLFALRWGISGVAFASVLSKLLFIAVICLHFALKTNTLRFVRCFRAGDLFIIVRSGIVKASTYALEALYIFVLNLFVRYYFPEETLVLLVPAEKLLGLTTLFIGLSMAVQPLIGTLKGEDNFTALRSLMKTVFADMITAGAVLTALTMFSAPLLIRLFGVEAEPLRTEGIAVLRIIGSTLIAHAVLVQLFIYLYLMDRELQAFFIGLMKNLIAPLTAVILLSVLTGRPIGLWAGIAVSPVVSLLISCAAVHRHCVKEGLEFPFLLPGERDRKAYVYDFELTPENITEMSRTADALMKEISSSERANVFVGIFIEEIFMLVLEKNAGRSKLYAECTIRSEPAGVRLILRDSGVIFNATEEDALPDSFRRYIVANLMTVSEEKTYLTTTGYNRNELIIPV